jgi:homogentisate 1,2-dioxygenase
VKHSGRYTKIDLPYWKSAPNVDPDVISLGQYRWDPVPHTDERLTWLTGMRTMTTAGDVNTQVGMATHIYLVTESMQDAYFYSADSELLVVPQEGRLRFCTELGVIDLEPKEIAILPRGLVYRVEVLEGPAGLRLRELRPEVRVAGARADRRQLHGQPARLQDAGRGV